MNFDSKMLRRKWREGLVVGFGVGLMICLLPIIVCNQQQPERRIDTPAPSIHMEYREPFTDDR